MKALSRPFVGVQVFPRVAGMLLYNDTAGSTRCLVAYLEDKAVEIDELDPCLAHLAEIARWLHKTVDRFAADRVAQQQMARAA